MSLAIATTLIATGTGTGYAQERVDGDYLCTVAEKASITSIHLEDADPPFAGVDDQLPTRFRMRITQEDEGDYSYRMIEIPYDGDDRDPRTWHTENSILHSAYLGNGIEFSAIEGQSFLSIHPTVHDNSDGDISFYHAGFEYPGGEDTELSVRWGRCRLTGQ